jgi:hypothetical protein
MFAFFLDFLVFIGLSTALLFLLWALWHFHQELRRR